MVQKMAGKYFGSVYYLISYASATGSYNDNEDAKMGSISQNCCSLKT